RDVLLEKQQGDMFAMINIKLAALYPSSHSVPTSFVPSAELWDVIALVCIPFLNTTKADILLLQIDGFQEYPQLLDPHLVRYMELLTKTFLAEISQPGFSPYTTVPEGNNMLLIEANSRLIYTLCKVRGWKVICRFLPNDAQWLEPMAKLLEDATKYDFKGSWQLSSTLLLWLAHLSLTPFDLATISSA